MLDRGRGPVLWITGPPGSGKTTLVAGYLAARRQRALWYQLDVTDADLAAFFHVLAGAAPRGRRRSARSPAPLRPEDWTRLPTFARRWFEQFYRGLPPSCTLVLDNYHEVPEWSRLHDALVEGLSVLPRGVRVLVLSRDGPPPAFRHVSGPARPSMIRWRQLRLTLAESTGLVRARGLRLEPRAMRALHERADGWAAGLVLMLEGAEPATGSPDTVGAAPQRVFNYLASEAFARMEGDTQQFLLATAFLPQMTAPMAAALSGLHGAGEVLERLAATGFFTERRDEPEPLYRYHPLFRDFLLDRARDTCSATRLGELRRQAARLLAERDQFDAAVALLREAGDWETLAALTARRAGALVAQGRRQTLEEWIGSLPTDLVADDGWLQYWLGTSRTPFAPGLARGHLERAWELFRERGDVPGLLSAWAGAVGATLYEWGNVTPLDAWIERFEELRREHEPFPSPELETRVVCTLFYALMFRQPQHPEIEQWAERALTLSRTADVDRRLHTGFLLTTFWLWKGEHARAAVTLEVVQDLARSRDASPLAVLTCRVIEAYYHWHRASPTRCLQAVADGLAEAEASGIRIMDAHLRAQGIYGSLVSGDLATARVHLRGLAPLAAGTGGLHDGQYRFLAAWEAHLAGDLPRALEHVKVAVRLPVESGMPFPQAWTHVGAAQLFHDLGDDGEARAHLERARAMVGELRSPLLEHMCLLTEAVFQMDGRDDERGLVALRRALALGRQAGLLAFPWWRPSMMARLAARALEADIEVDYVRDLVRRHRLVADVPELAPASWPWAVAVRTLGGFTLVTDGVPVRFSGKVQHRPLALLKAVIALGGREVAESDLSDALWPDADGDAGRQALATTLHRLRALLRHEGSVRLQERRLGLDARHVWLDVWAFERRLAEAAQAERRGRTAEAVRLSEEALALYRGPFLPGDSAALWTVATRERLRAKFLRQTAKLGQHWAAAGEIERALECYERGLEVDDLAEQFYEGLMRSYLAAGRRAEGLRVYDRCRHTLAARLHVDPSPETESLRRALQAT